MPLDHFAPITGGCEVLPLDAEEIARELELPLGGPMPDLMRQAQVRGP